MRGQHLYQRPKFMATADPDWGCLADFFKSAAEKFLARRVVLTPRSLILVLSQVSMTV